jgi:serine-type D-Ala-D-Ala carboxypeptidase/endopeptidase (penicillin-binding protein 4)
LRVTEKTSQNLHAETYLHLVARERLGLGSRAAGLSELATFLDEAKVDQEQYRFYDGSGLSRLNVVTPHAVTTLLRYMAKSPVNDDWFSLLAVSGVDGTLEHRMKNQKIKGRIVGKTGSLSHVSALSGYILRRNGTRYAFSILVNNYNAPTSDVRELIDKLCSLLVD